MFLLVGTLLLGGVFLLIKGKWWRAEESVPVETGEVANVPEAAPAEKIIVHVAGAVLHPGVYQLDKGMRVVDAIKAAGGETEEANVNTLNLAARLADGQKVLVPSKSQISQDSPSGYVASNMRSGGKVNINSATSQELEQLPGVGPSLAAAIVQYRERYGPFTATEDLQKVSGIGPKKYEQIAPYITVD